MRTAKEPTGLLIQGMREAALFIVTLGVPMKHRATQQQVAQGLGGRALWGKEK